MSVLPLPYYKDDLVTLYHGDCRELLPLMHGDAVVTDPPYGIGFQYASHDDNREAWFQLMDEVVPLMRESAPFVVMPSCGIDRLGWWYANHPPTWIIAWHKGSPGHLSKIGFNDWESHVVWGRPWKQMHDHFQSPCGFNDPRHPCPKPIEWGRWLVERAVRPGGCVLDPFAGSGTTLWAAKNLGRRAVGIEIEEAYCDLVVEKCAQEVLAVATVDVYGQDVMDFAGAA